MELIMFAEVRTHRSSSLKGRANHCSVKFVAQTMCVSNATVKGIGLVSAMHALSRCGDVNIVMQNLTRSNRLNATNVRVSRVGGRVAATDVDGQGTGQTSVTRAFRNFNVSVLKRV